MEVCRRTSDFAIIAIQPALPRRLCFGAGGNPRAIGFACTTGSPPPSQSEQRRAPSSIFVIPWWANGGPAAAQRLSPHQPSKARQHPSHATCSAGRTRPSPITPDFFQARASLELLLDFSGASFGLLFGPALSPTHQKLVRLAGH